MNKTKNIYADMDPIEEIRAVREKISRRFKTASDMCEYLRKRYPIANPPPPQPRRKEQSDEPKPGANARPAVRRRKSAVHT